MVQLPKIPLFIFQLLFMKHFSLFPAEISHLLKLDSFSCIILCFWFCPLNLISSDNRFESSPFQMTRFQHTAEPGDVSRSESSRSVCVFSCRLLGAPARATQTLTFQSSSQTINHFGLCGYSRAEGTHGGGG